MGPNHNLILSGTEAFSKGSMDNVTLQDGCIVLDGHAGRHMPFGCYTSPEFALPPFCNLNVSWNANTPTKTVVEAQCRILAGGVWTEWMTFGKWSPEYPRRSPGSIGYADNRIFCMSDGITVAVPGGGTGVQLRVYLYSDDEKQTPTLRLLSASARPLAWEKQDGLPVNRTLYLPEYSLQSRDPSFGLSMDLPVILTAMLNRYGEDILPEELAYGMSDGATASCRNAAYAAAMVSSCGYRCLQLWADIKDLRTEIRSGFAAAAELELPNARDGGTHWVGVYGFSHDENRHNDIVLFHDPSAEPGEVARTLSLEDFRRVFTGRIVALRRRPHGFHGTRPSRVTCALKPGVEPGEYQFDRRGDPWPLPEDFDGWVAAAAHDGVAHATTAGRTFVRLEPLNDGGVKLPAALLTPGARYTVYAVDETGAARVAELRLPGTPPKPPAEEPAAKQSKR